VLHLVPRSPEVPSPTTVLSVCVHGFVRRSRTLMLQSAGYVVEEAETAVSAGPLLRSRRCEILVLGQLVPIQHKRVLAAAAIALGVFVVTICEDCEIEREMVRADSYLDSLCPTRLLKVVEEAEARQRAA
jgi:hypothetical protein